MSKVHVYEGHPVSAENGLKQAEKGVTESS